MLDWVPTRAWLLLVIALIACPQAIMVYRLATNRVQDDLICTADRQDELNRERLPLHVLLLISLAGLAIFIFTSTAERFAHSPSFWPIIMAGLALFSLYFTISGAIHGSVEPLVQSSFGPYSRQEQPIRYWLSMLWNALMTIIMICAISWMYEAP